MDTATMLEQAMRYVDSYRDVLQSQNPDDWELEKVEAFIADVRDEMLRREYAPAAAELDTLRAENARLAAALTRIAARCNEEWRNAARRDLPSGAWSDVALIAHLALTKSEETK